MSSFLVTGGGEKILRKLAKSSNKAAAALRDMRPAMKQVSVFLDAWVQRNFRTEGGNVGGWEPFQYGGRVQNQRILRERAAIAGTTAASRAKSVAAKTRAYNRASASVFAKFSLGSGGGTVVDQTAKLLQDTGTLRGSYRPFHSSDDAGIGSDLPYAEHHEEGEGVPARRMVPEGPDVAPQVRDILASYAQREVVDEIEKAFRK